MNRSKWPDGSWMGQESIHPMPRSLKIQDKKAGGSEPLLVGPASCACFRVHSFHQEAYRPSSLLFIFSHLVVLLRFSCWSYHLIRHNQFSSPLHRRRSGRCHFPPTRTRPPFASAPTAGLGHVRRQCKRAHPSENAIQSNDKEISEIFRGPIHPSVGNQTHKQAREQTNHPLPSQRRT